jgi:hypothetical protein
MLLCIPKQQNFIKIFKVGKTGNFHSLRGGWQGHHGGLGWVKAKRRSMERVEQQGEMLRGRRSK